MAMAQITIEKLYIKRIVLRFLTILFLPLVLVFSKPMESIENYNVILVHGAADKRSGLDCNEPDYNKEAYEYKKKEDSTDTDYLNRVGGYKDWVLFWENNFHGGTLFQLAKTSGATGMVNGLREWLTENIFENDKRAIYLQRPFTNPANSPAINAQELGSKAWKGQNHCKERHSLIEEAQEVKAKGRKELIDLRKNVESRGNLPASRNILISHSMGGVTSREYVQGDFYNDDVDKVITLDSPHKGTHSLDGLIHMKEWIENPAKETAMQGFAAALAWGLVMVALEGGPPSDYQSLIWIATGIAGLNILNAVTSAAVDLFLGYGYEESDPLVPYIRPNSPALNKLNSKPYSDSLPMMRILSSEGGLTFGSNREYAQDLVSRFVPDALYVPVKNSIAQFSHTEISSPAYYNNLVTSIALGMVGGISLTDHGSALIPHWSGAAEDVSALDNSNGNSKFYKFAANENASLAGVQPFGITLAAVTALGVAAEIGVFNPTIAKVSRLAIAALVGATLAAYMAPVVLYTQSDFDLGHRMPILPEYQSDWKGTPNTYTKITGEKETIAPYQMEEFLYEKPFANVRIKSSYSSDWKDTLSDTLGLYIGDSLEPLYIAKTLENFTPLKFKSTSDWEIMGAKKERWEMTKGVGDEKIPIRHADRYPMPPVMVKDFITTVNKIGLSNPDLALI